MFRGYGLALGLGLVTLSGCLYPVAERIDGTVCDLAAHLRDPQPLLAADRTPVQQVRFDEENKDGQLPPPRRSSRVPDELLPGGKPEPLSLPPESAGKEARQEAYDRLYPDLPDMGEDLPDPPGPEGRPLSLADLQKLALANSPLIRQAVARVEEARGAALQAGLLPNPTVGYEADTMFTGGGPGYQGGFIEQRVRTGNKIQLERAVAAMDLASAEVALKTAQADLATRVRSGYFSVIVAKESIRINRALIQFANYSYRAQIDQVRKGGIAAPYEPLYVRVLANQAMLGLIQARNRRTAAWKQLASTLGLPGLPPVALCGQVDMPIPDYCFKDVLAQVLASNTDNRTAELGLQQAKYRLELARQVPVPDVNLRIMLQKDRTSPTALLAPSVVLGVPIPVWDHNQGNILSAQAALIRAEEELHRVRADLTTRLTTAFERYQNSRRILAYQRDRILPDLVRVYQGVYDRYNADPGGAAAEAVAFADIVVAKQSLADAIRSYLDNLGQLWQSVVDVTDLLQTPDLFGMDTKKLATAKLPDLEHLPGVPCSHCCSPIQDGHQRVFDGAWPAADRPDATSARPAAKAKKTEKQETLPLPNQEKKSDKKDRDKDLEKDLIKQADRDTSVPLPPLKIPPPGP